MPKGKITWPFICEESKVKSIKLNKINRELGIWWIYTNDVRMKHLSPINRNHTTSLLQWYCWSPNLSAHWSITTYYTTQFGWGGVVEGWGSKEIIIHLNAAGRSSTVGRLALYTSITSIALIYTVSFYRLQNLLSLALTVGDIGKTLLQITVHYPPTHRSMQQLEQP